MSITKNQKPKDKKGLVYVFTGNGKGKTSAALGVAMRAVGNGMKVGWVGFYKQESWGLSELKPLRDLGVEVWLMGEGFHIRSQEPPNVKTTGQAGIGSQRVRIAPVGSKGQVVVDRASEEDHKRAAREALEKVRELIDNVDMLVMDEVNNAVKDNLIDLIDLIDLISVRGETHIILTGRDAEKEVMAAADLVTEMKKIKHPYDIGKLAVKGLDY